MRSTDHHLRRRWRSAFLAAIACALLLVAAVTYATYARLTPTASAAPIPLASTHVSVAPSPTVQQATPSATPASASQPILPCTGDWCSMLNVEHWWLLGGPLLAVAGLVLLLAMRAEMRTARAGSRRAKRAANKAKRRAERKTARRAAWARLLRRKPHAPPVSHIWDDQPDETYPSGPLLPPAAPGWPNVRRSSYTTARLPGNRDDERS